MTTRSKVWTQPERLVVGTDGDSYEVRPDVPIGVALSYAKARSLGMLSFKSDARADFEAALPREVK